MQKRRFKHGAANHVYQRTINRYNIFYDHFDYIVYFTILSVVSEKYDILISGLCLMIDHIHILINARCKTILSRFLSHVTSLFVREYNSSVGRHGPLFEERFGSAPKSDKKRLLSCIIYIGNNPVERGICDRAESYRWNFIAYMSSRHPFSEELIVRRASAKLKKALSVVDHFRDAGRYLNYKILQFLYEGLDGKESEQLTDYIICRYNVIDYESVRRHFESYDHLLTSMCSTTGSEFDIKEQKDRFSDLIYYKMADVVRREVRDSVREVIVWDREAKIPLANRLLRMVGVTREQVCRFLHLDSEWLAGILFHKGHF